jgi:Spy/CpxP family protein refolding chaperone
MRPVHAIALAGLVISHVQANAQMHGGQHHGRPVTPYAGLDQRSVKALSDQQIADLRGGRGMGLALPAELNGYPGPPHVLEHADALNLTDAQRSRATALLDKMKAETIAVGERIIAEETALDRLFAEGRITTATLTQVTGRIAAAQGELRAAHLRYHLTMRDALTPEQVARYNKARGYGQR